MPQTGSEGAAYRPQNADHASGRSLGRHIEAQKVTEQPPIGKFGFRLFDQRLQYRALGKGCHVKSYTIKKITYLLTHFMIEVMQAPHFR